LQKIFVLQRAEGGSPPSVVVANEGQVTADSNGLQWLTLKDGSRYEGHFTGKQFQVSEFREYSLVIRQQEMERSNRKAAAKPTLALLGTQDNQLMAELQWRLSLPLSILVLTFLVVPMARVNPRQGVTPSCCRPSCSISPISCCSVPPGRPSTAGVCPTGPGCSWCPGLSAADRVASQPAGHQLVERGQGQLFKRKSA
jgi:hypothetical protein